MAKNLEHINLVFIGHVDHGKSTTVGRLMFDAGVVDEQTMRKLKEKAANLGKAGFEFAYVMDNLKEEQERGVTIDINHKKFQTAKYDFTIIDAPGHRDFIKNMITGASQADAAVLVVAANDGINAQTKEHVFLAKTLGVQQLIVCLNKMDLQQYKQDRYNQVKDEVSKLLMSVGYKPADIHFIPVASLHGENIKNKSTNMPWYTGLTLLEAMDTLRAPERPTSLPLRLPIQDVYNITGIGVVPVGRVETGILKLGQKVIVLPGRDGKGVVGEVKTIEMHHEQFQEAKPGDNIGFNVRGINKKDIARGDVLGDVSNPPTVATEFQAQIVVLNHPSVITVGYTPVFHIHTAQIACQFIALQKKLSPEQVDNPDFLKTGESALVLLRPIQPLVIERVTDFGPLGRFAIRDSGVTVAAGVCKEITKKA